MLDPLLPTKPPVPRPAPGAPDGDPVLRGLCAELETSFLSEMLGHAGLAAAPGGFGGGIGEEQFGSFLRQEQAAALVRAGGLGLAESLFRAMSARADGRA